MMLFVARSLRCTKLELRQLRHLVTAAPHRETSIPSLFAFNLARNKWIEYHTISMYDLFNPIWCTNEEHKCLTAFLCHLWVTLTHQHDITISHKSHIQSGLWPVWADVEFDHMGWHQSWRQTDRSDLCRHYPFSTLTWLGEQITSCLRFQYHVNYYSTAARSSLKITKYHRPVSNFSYTHEFMENSNMLGKMLHRWDQNDLCCDLLLPQCKDWAQLVRL